MIASSGEQELNFYSEYCGVNKDKNKMQHCRAHFRLEILAPLLVVKQLKLGLRYLPPSLQQSEV